VRPYAPSKARLVVAVWELGALAFLHRTTVDLFHLAHLATPLLLVTGAAWVWLCWRLAVMGVYTAPHGVLVRGLVTRRVLAWRELDRITVADATFRVGRLRVPAGRTIWFETRAGERVDSTLYADGIDFRFRRPLFARLHDDLRRRHRERTAPATMQG
jgi:hypothetical protein